MNCLILAYEVRKELDKVESRRTERDKRPEEKKQITGESLFEKYQICISLIGRGTKDLRE